MQNTVRFLKSIISNTTAGCEQTNFPSFMALFTSREKEWRAAILTRNLPVAIFSSPLPMPSRAPQ